MNPVNQMLTIISKIKKKCRKCVSIWGIPCFFAPRLPKLKFVELEHSHKAKSHKVGLR